MVQGISAAFFHPHPIDSTPTMYSATRHRTLPLVVLLFCGILLAGAMPDAVAQDPKTETTDTGSRMAIVVVKNRSVLRMDLRVARVYFSREKLAAADLNTEKADVGRYVDSVKVWTEEVRKKGGNPALPRSYRRARKKAARQFVMRVNDPSLQRALLKHQAERMIRQMPPPYDTVRVRRGQTVNAPDFSLHYGIVFPDSTRRNQFLEDVKGLSSVVEARKPATAKDIDLDISNVPPNDLNGSNTDQWNIDENISAGINMADAWEIMKDLRDVREAEISFIEPNEDEDSLPTPNHRDLIDNIEFNTSNTKNSYYSTHIIEVSSVAGAATNNSTDIAGATYNQPIEVRQTSIEVVNDIDPFEQLALQIEQSDSKVINLSWHSEDNIQAI